MKNWTHAAAATAAPRRPQKLLALGLLLAFGGAAQAQQSGVTIYGKIDMGVGKSIGSSTKAVQDGAGSRLGFRANEDIGGGWRGLVHLEHRLEPDTGRQANATRFWQGLSTVGLGTPFGSIHLGRQYTSAYSLAQNVIDPWGGESVAEMRTAWRGGISKTRISDSLRYDYSSGGLSLSASIGQAAQESPNAGPDRPVSLAASYGSGPLTVVVGWEDPAHAKDSLLNLGASYKLGSTRLVAGLGSGKTTASHDFRALLLGLSHTFGAHEIKAGWTGTRTRSPAGATSAQTRKLGLGYFHHFSKRTFLYANVAHDGKVAQEKTGYDLGLQHRF